MYLQKSHNSEILTKVPGESPWLESLAKVLGQSPQPKSPARVPRHPGSLVSLFQNYEFDDVLAKVPLIISKYLQKSRVRVPGQSPQGWFSLLQL